MKKIDSFQGEYRFLSNFWPCLIFFEERLYPTLEHAYQASKVQDDLLKDLLLIDCPTPGKAKVYWEEKDISLNKAFWNPTRKMATMKKLLRIKFSGQEPFLTKALLSTKDSELIEGNTWGDTFWGVVNGMGENNLGKLLMELRENLFQEKEQLAKGIADQQPRKILALNCNLSRKELFQKLLAFDLV